MLVSVPVSRLLICRLDSLQQVHRVHCQEKENIISGLAKSVACAEELENRYLFPSYLSVRQSIPVPLPALCGKNRYLFPLPARQTIASCTLPCQKKRYPSLPCLSEWNLIQNVILSKTHTG